MLRSVDRVTRSSLTGRLFLFAKARNEALRLPYFLDYYFGRGVDHIFLIDNGSDDETVAIARSYPNVHVFSTRENFRNYSNWMEVMLDRYGRGHWCVAVDLDEIFIYPGYEHMSLGDLVDHLDSTGHTAVQSLLLDMYSNRPIRLNAYTPGQDPLEVCPYFDPDFEERIKMWLNKNTLRRFPCARPTGNLRARMFNASVNLSKVSLFKYGPGVFAGEGMHAVDGVAYSPIRGAVLHFKYLQDFNARAVEEAARGVYASNASAYQKYAARVSGDKDLNCYCENSVRFEDSAQLVRLGIMRTTPELDFIVATAANR